MNEKQLKTKLKNFEDRISYLEMQFKLESEAEMVKAEESGEIE